MNKTYFDLLIRFISFKSISTDPYFQGDCEACADWLIELFQDHHFHTKKITWYGNPLVFASYEIDPNAKTYLIYGHYDVQPADISDGRDTDPFELTQSGNKLIARWSVDNKGQIMIHIATILELISSKELKYNIKFLIEGDEETGSPQVNQCIQDHKELLSCDTAIISDGEIIWNHTPTMTASFRGWANMTIELQTAKTDLHSWLFGNIAPSASHESAKLISKLYDASGSIAIPWWYDGLKPITQAHTENNAKVPFDESELKQMTWIKSLISPRWYDPVTANGLLPTIQVSWLYAGYTWSGYKNIIPWSSIIKINFRFWPWQDACKKVQAFEAWLAQIIPDYVEYTISTSDPYDAISINTDNEDTQKAAQLLSWIYGKQTIMRYCGAAVPISGLFQDILKCDVVIADLANEDCNMHWVGENFDIGCIEKGLEFSRQFFSN